MDNINEIKYGRQIIDDSFHPEGDLPRCKLEDSAKTENERNNWHNANKRYAACASMYRWLDEQGILKKEAFCYDVIPEKDIDGKHYRKQINFAVDSKDLMKYKDEMLNSGVENAEIAVSAILAKEGNTVEPSHLSGATCLTWTMQTYRDNGGCVGRSWETIHEQYYNRDYSVKGLGGIVDRHFDALKDLQENVITEDDFYNTIKAGVERIFELDRTVFLSNISPKLIKDTKNPDYKTVTLPCDKSISDSGWMRFTVKTEDIHLEGDKNVISLGDFEDGKVKVSVMKDSLLDKSDEKLANGKHYYTDIYQNKVDIAKNWNKHRKEYVEEYKKTNGAPVDLIDIPNDCIGRAKGYYTSYVKLDDIGTIYVSNRQITKGDEYSSIHFEYGLENIKVYNKDENNDYSSRYTNAKDLAKEWLDHLDKVNNIEIEEDLGR